LSAECYAIDIDEVLWRLHQNAPKQRKGKEQKLEIIIIRFSGAVTPAQASG
jgi:hypothetical protein